MLFRSIAVIKGRNNFPCNFSLSKNADDMSIPCTIEIREKNTKELFSFLEENPQTSPDDFAGTSEIRRMNVAPACPMWAPIMPSNIEPKSLGDFKKIKFDTVSGKEYALFQRKKGCPYYDQYESYAHSDVLIFNSMKYLIENALGRKPKTDIEIDRKSTRLNSSHSQQSRMPSSA